jgi:predicted phosphoribosyltransferase
MDVPVFTDRRQAGRVLANRLRGYERENPVILALPRGGAPIGLEVAKALHAPLDIVIVRKIGAPMNPEYGIGAIAEDGSYWIDIEAAERTGATGATLQEITHRAATEVKRRVKMLRRDRAMISVAGRTVIVVDDGMATGVSAVAAARFLRGQGARKITLAVPVCSSDTALAIYGEVDEVICLSQPEAFFAVGSWYENFPQLTDKDVIADLEAAREALMKKAA